MQFRIADTFTDSLAELTGVYAMEGASRERWKRSSRRWSTGRYSDRFPV